LASILKRLASLDLPGKADIEEYLRDQHRRHCRPNTLRNSFITIEIFLKFVKGTGKYHLEELNRRDLESWIEHEQDRGLKPSTINMRLRTLKAFIRFLIERDKVDPDVLSKRLCVKVPDALPRAMDPEDEKRLIGVLDDVRDRAMVMVLLRTGMRIGELLNTLVSEIHLREKKIEIYEAEKTRVGRVVYLSDDAMIALKAWLRKRNREYAYLFYGYGGHPLSYEAARGRVMRLLNVAGLEEKGYSLHCLRHTFATDLLNAGMRLECLQQLLGHSSIEMTRRYARLTDKTREEEYFRAMLIIEREEANVDRRFDHPLQTAPQTPQLLTPHAEVLHEQS
jgi:integrase/recombinase XerD